MCGIWCLIKSATDQFPISDDQVKALVGRLENRGPEGTRIQTFLDQVILGFTRLAINGLNPNGMQPFIDGDIITICNGEIYNYKAIAAKYNFTLTSGSDCEVLSHLYRHFIDCPEYFWRELDGVFAAVVVDLKRRTLMVGRDPYGVRPLFIGTCASNNRFADYDLLGFSSELKGLADINEFESIQQFSPGHFHTYDLATMTLMTRTQYHMYPGDIEREVTSNCEVAKRDLRAALKAAVHKRMLTERPVAALLSGGIDSSLIAALVAEELRAAGGEPLKTFSIGFAGSEDLRFARLVADHIGSDHHEIIKTPEEFFAAIPEVIKDIESFDTTSVRASVGNWLVAREIRRQTDCKVVFNGDGSDEVFGSYMYFYKAPSDEAYEAETIRLLKDICYFDVLRSDRSISSHGLEPRTPFLDKTFVQVAHNIAVELRRPVQGLQVEKWILREAFAGTGLLPDAVLWRKKEAFSDGVSGPTKLWYEEIQDRVTTTWITPNPDQRSGSVEIQERLEASRIMPPAAGEIQDRIVNLPTINTYNHMKPMTPEDKPHEWGCSTSELCSREDIYYRTIFESLYKDRATVIPYKWMPRWIEGATDPSARTLKVYDEA